MPEPRAAYKAIRECRSYVLSHLIETMEERSRPGVDWIANERLAVAVAANEWAEAHGQERRITVARHRAHREKRRTTPTERRPERTAMSDGFTAWAHLEAAWTSTSSDDDEDYVDA